MQPERPKLGPLVPAIDAIPEADRTAPLEQRRTAKRIFHRLRDEHSHVKKRGDGKAAGV